MVYAALQILYPRFLAVQNFVRFVCFFLCEKQVPHIIFQLLVGLGITSKQSESTAKETEKHSHAYSLWLSHQFNFSTRWCHTLVFSHWNHNEPKSILFLPFIWYYMRISLSERKFSFARSVYAHLFIYFLSLFYIYQPERFADRNCFSFQLNFLQHFSPLTGPRHGRLRLQSGQSTPDTHGSIIRYTITSIHIIRWNLL